MKGTRLSEELDKIFRGGGKLTATEVVLLVLAAGVIYWEITEDMKDTSSEYVVPALLTVAATWLAYKVITVAVAGIAAIWFIPLLPPPP